MLYLVTTKWLVFIYITYHIKFNEPCVSSFVCITTKFNQDVNAFSQMLTELLLISAYGLELQIDLYTFPSRISCTNWTKDQSIFPHLIILVILLNFLPSLWYIWILLQGAKKVIFTACHSGKLKLTFTGQNIISTSPKNVLMSRLISQYFCNLNSSKNFTCPLGQLKTESTSPGLLDTTFFARYIRRKLMLLLGT